MSKNNKIDFLDESKVIGYICYPKTPFGFLEANRLAKELENRGFSMLYFSYRNFEKKGNLIKGYIYHNEEWREGFYSIPKYIDNAPPNNREQREIYLTLQHCSQLLCHRLGNKEKVIGLLAKNKELSQFLIRSYPFEVNALFDFLKYKDAVILKSKRSSQGRGVFLIRKENNFYSISDGCEKYYFDMKNAEEILGKYLKPEWIIQDYIKSLVPSNNKPFDIRVGVYRQNEDGEWAVANPYARIGNNEVTSNLARGGVAIPGDQFLREHFFGQELNILEKLKNISEEIAITLQNEYDFLIDALGIDYGIENGNIYIFEVNTYPGMKGNMDQVVKLKVNYYQSLICN